MTSSLFSFVPSAADVAVLAAVGNKAPDAAKYPHAARWFRQIQSYDEKARKSFAKAKKTDYVSASSAAAASKDDDDDEVDLVSADLGVHAKTGPLLY